MGSSRPAVHVARGATYLIARTVVTSIVSIAAFAIIARLISKNEMGELAVLMLVTSGSSFIAGLGVSPTATKFVASFNASGEYEKMRSAGYGCLIINTLATVILSAAVFFSSDPLASTLLGSFSKASLLRLLTLEIAALSLNSSLIGILTGLKFISRRMALWSGR